MNSGYDSGYNIGHQSGYNIGRKGGDYDPGHDHCSVAYDPGHHKAYDSYNAGHHHGYDAGYHKGRRDLQRDLDGYDEGKRRSVSDGESDGDYDAGRTHEDYERGYSSQYRSVSHHGDGRSSPRRREEESRQAKMRPRDEFEKDKWYVGFTERKDGERFNEHFLGEGAMWTKKYKPIRVMEWREGTLEDEDKVTLEYMKKYGWLNVRGGSWCRTNMERPPDELIPMLPKELKHEDKITCYRCGGPGHEGPDCCGGATIDGTSLTYKKDVTCYKCGETGHYASSCYKTEGTHIYYNDEEESSSSSSSSSIKIQQKESCLIS